MFFGFLGEEDGLLDGIVKVAAQQSLTCRQLDRADECFFVEGVCI